MHDLFASFSRFFQELGPVAYAVAALLALGESVIVVAYFLPGVMIMAFIGFLCYLGVYDFWGMALAIYLGHLAGEHLNYLLGRHQGRPLFKPHSRFFKADTLAIVEQGFHQGAVHYMLVGHFVGVLRPLISFTAGMVHYPLLRFAAVMAALSFFWALLYLGAGYVLGASWAQAGRYLERFGYAVVIVAVVVGYLLWRGRKRLVSAAGLTGSTRS